jgi:hypothetical protein
MKPTVHVLGTYLPGQKIVLISGPSDASEKIDVPSPLERYFGHPIDSSYDQLTYIDHYSRYSVDAGPASCDVDKDVCEPVRFANSKKNSAICILRSFHPRMHELFALRLILRRFPARSWADLRFHNGEVHQTFHEAARQLGLVSIRDQEAEICLQDAIDLNRLASDIRFRLAQMVYYGASRESLETHFCDQLADDGDTPDSVRRKIDFLLHPFDMSSHDGLRDDQPPISSYPVSLLTSEQHSVASKIIKTVLHKTHQLMFLQGSAGTGKTLIVKALINAFQSHGKKCLICETTGIAAVQYPSGITFHSLFRLGIDEQSRGSFRLNIGRGTPLARYILAADLIIIDQVWKLTPWVVNRVSLALQSISIYEKIQFGGKRILFVGDLLQLPPLFRIFQSCPSRIDSQHVSRVGAQFENFKSKSP